MDAKTIDRREHQLEQLLVGKDPRQVHVRHRTTDELIYLDEGKGKVEYERTRTDLACIVADCHVPITFVEGEEVRLHYRHPKGVANHEPGLRELHAIARIAQQWTVRQGFTGTTVSEIPTGIAVLVAQEGAATAEYHAVSKKLRPEDLTFPSTPFQWLIWSGIFGELSDVGELRLPSFVRTLLRNRQNVLVISPDEGVVGTLVRKDAPDLQPTGAVVNCGVEAARIDDCTVDEDGLIVTPTHRRQGKVLEERQQRLERRRIQEAEQRAQKTVPSAPKPQFMSSRRPFALLGSEYESPVRVRRKPAPAHWDREASWESSEIYEAVHRKFGDLLPDWLAGGGDGEWELDVLPVHWHATLYFKELLNARRPLSAEKLAKDLSRRGWPEEAAKQLAESDLVPAYLERLVKAGVARRTENGKYARVSKGDRRRSR